MLQQPGLLFLDEAAGALDPQARVDFHQAIKDNCPRVTVISVMHEAIPPRSATGAEFYDSVLNIADGIAMKSPLMPRLPRELTTIVAQATHGPQPAEAKRLRFPARIKQR
jgi:ABC-type Mn2+/Zn2+ transport system ATPase subunit